MDNNCDYYIKLMNFCSECNAPNFSGLDSCDECILKAIRMPTAAGKAMQVARENRNRVDSLITFKGFNLAEKING